MTIKDNNVAEKTAENVADQTSVNQPDSPEAHRYVLLSELGELKSEFNHVSIKLKEEAVVLTSDAMEFVKHPDRLVNLGASLAEGAAGESIGEMLGAGLGTMIGPEGTLIGAELGGMVGEVFGIREGSQISKKIFHQTVDEHPLTEDLQQEGSSKVGSHAGKLIGGMIGDALFDDVGGEIGETVGSKIGSLAGNIAYQHVAKAHTNNDDESSSDEIS